MAAPDPFLNTGAASNTISSSTGWTDVLNSEKLSPTATADGVTTTISDGSRLGNVSISSTALEDVVYASDGNYQYFLQTFPSGGTPTPVWDAAWLGDPNGCECHENAKPELRYACHVVNSFQSQASCLYQ